MDQLAFLVGFLTVASSVTPPHALPPADAFSAGSSQQSARLEVSVQVRPGNFVTTLASGDFTVCFGDAQTTPDA